jgi:YD repeat-containing protein
VLAQVRDSANPNYPERQGRLRQVLSLNSGNGTSRVEISYAYADEVTCTDPDDPSTCPEAGPPAQLASLARGDITTELTFDGSSPVAERSYIAPGSATGLRDTEYGITLNTKFQRQADRVTLGNDIFAAAYGYDIDGVLTCAAAGTTCNASTGIVYLFDGRSSDPTPSRHGLLEGTTAQAIAETFGYNSFGELTTHNVQADAATVLSISYGARDPLGRILAQTTKRSSGGTSVGYTYDEKGQLLTVTLNGGVPRSNVYDKNGNRLCTYEAPATDCDEAALYDAQDRLREFEGVTYNYTDRRFGR